MSDILRRGTRVVVTHTRSCGIWYKSGMHGKITEWRAGKSTCVVEFDDYESYGCKPSIFNPDRVHVNKTDLMREDALK